MQEVNQTEIAGTEIQIGDVLVLPVSRNESISHLEVICIDEDDETKVYLKQEDQRYTLSTAEAIAFAVLTGDDIEPTEILAIEKPEELQIPDEQDDTPTLEDINLGGE